jgi:tetratricopeptide (TPR) repeat protein
MRSGSINSARSVLRPLARGLFVVLVAASLGACSSLGSIGGWFSSDKDNYKDEPADKLYNEGLFLLNQKNDYKDAAKKFEEVDRQHPYSDWARKSLLMTAYTYYEAGEYDDSINAAKRYVTLHPGSPDAAYAQYLIGASYFDQIPDVTRDQQRTERAIAALEEVIRKFPSSEVSDHTPRRGGAAAPHRGLYGARHRLRGADRRRRARAQFPRQPVVPRRLQAGEVRWPRADREQGLLDEPRLQEGRARLTLDS